MIQRMKEERKINIFDLVKQLRLQRMKMVQTPDQYALLYTSAAELCETRAQQPEGKRNSTRDEQKKNSTFFLRSSAEPLAVLREFEAFQAI